MPTPTIPAGNKYMDAVLRNGFGSAGGAITSLQFQPDFIWEKTRSSASDNNLANSIAGSTKLLASNTTAAEATNTTYITGFTSNGYTFGTGDYGTSTTLVDWVWKAGGTAVTNTSGSISSQVSANTTSGFSVVTYTGTGSAATIGHGLGVAPSIIFVKGRGAVDNWVVYSSSFSAPANDYLVLNSTAAKGTIAGIWGATATSTVFSIGGSGGSGTFVAYCWAPIAGYSAFGSYTGNGSADGPFIYLGFRPKYILIRCTNAAGGWKIYNTSGLNYNPINTSLEAQDSGAEATSSNFNIDWLSNGFKIRTTYSDFNTSGNTYIYMAFAEVPFKFSNAR